MVTRLKKIDAEAQAVLDRLIELYKLTDPAETTAEQALKAIQAREVFALWWQLYDLLVFWAQCEIVGEGLLRQRPGLVSMWRERHGPDPKEMTHFAEAAGYRFSVGGRLTKKRESDLKRVVGDDNVDFVEFLSKAGLSEPGTLVDELFIRSEGANNYLKEELLRLTASAEPQSGLAPLTEKDIEPAKPQARPSLPPTSLEPLDIEPGGDHAAPSKMPWKLEALRQVRLLVGRGFKKIAALTEIAVAINHPVDRLQDWERDLVKFSDYENDLYCAELVGEFDDFFRTGHYTNIPNHQRYGSFEGKSNMERASQIARTLRRVRIADIKSALRGVL
jgi:hypothetical protein